MNPPSAASTVATVPSTSTIECHSMNIGIAGAGLLGRLLAWQLARQGHQVNVYDPAPHPEAPNTGHITASNDGPPPAHAAAFTAAGMLSPLAELENAGPVIARLGWRSLRLWHDITAELGRQTGEPLMFRQLGSLMVAHGSDLGAAQRVLARLGEVPEMQSPLALDALQLQELEPAIAPDLTAWFLPQEGQILPRQVMPALCTAAPRVRWHWGQRVASVTPNTLTLQDGSVHRVDLAVDTRGLGARDAHTTAASALPVRGVRGEVLWLHAPGVQLQRPVRLLHPRHRVYLVPRPGDIVVVGASEIESEDRSPVSLRSAVELMAAAHSVLPELAEARIIHLETNLRPALPDNHPLIHIEPGLMRLNGLFRHGWLLAPAVVENALRQPLPQVSSIDVALA